MLKRNKKILIITGIILSLSSAAYLAADRYLIKHVEIADVSSYENSVYETASAANETLVEPAVNVEVVDVVDEEVEDTIESITFDDWNYQSSDISISIQEYSSGSGNNVLTYFVADVVVSDATLLSSAFADNQFGQNIIAYTSEIAEENNAIFAINGDYYGFRDDGIIIRNGVIYRDIPAREGLAFYLDGTMEVYDETETSAQELLDTGVWNTLSFGPALIDDGEIVEGIDNIEIDTNFGNHSIQGTQPRTGIGIIDANHFIFIVVDGRSKSYSMGVTMTEFAEIFDDLGCTYAYNLDGGGSSTMYFMGRVVNNPQGKNKERGTSDIMYIAEE